MAANENKRQHVYDIKNDKVITIYEPHTEIMADHSTDENDHILVLVTKNYEFEIICSDSNQVRQIRNFLGARVSEIIITKH